MKYAVMGAGSFGQRYAAPLAIAGHDITFIARGSNLENLKENGIHVGESITSGSLDVDSVKATDNPESIGEVDIVIIAVKTYQLDEAAQAMTPLIGDDTMVLPLQNGITAPDRIAEVVGRKHVIGHAGIVPVDSIGELDGPVSERINNIQQEFVDAGKPINIVDDIWTEMWQKLVGYASAAPWIVSRLDLAEAAESPEIMQLVQTAVHESVAVAQAAGIVLGQDTIESYGRNFFESNKTRAPKLRPSLLVDLDKGRPMELEDLVGVIVKKGVELGVSTPVIETCYSLLKPHANGRN